MHNKRIGRDDVLKIEVRDPEKDVFILGLTRICSGLGLPHQPLGDTRLDAVVVVNDVTEVLPVAAIALLHPDVETTPLARMIAGTATVIVSETVIETTTTVAAPAARPIEIETATPKMTEIDVMKIAMEHPQKTAKVRWMWTLLNPGTEADTRISRGLPSSRT